IHHSAAAAQRRCTGFQRSPSSACIAAAKSSRPQGGINCVTADGQVPSQVDEEIVWRGMTRAQLDAAYNNSAAVRNSAEKLAEWAARSANLRAKMGELLDLRYGPRERNRIDLFRCGQRAAPLLVFIHGGYWQRNSKEIFGCMAEGPLALGLDV